MRKCDFCQHDSRCSGVQRSECIVRDFYHFEVERTPADDETTIARLIAAFGGVPLPMALAKYLVRNGVGIKTHQ